LPCRLPGAGRTEAEYPNRNRGYGGERREFHFCQSVERSFAL
jgi:hypothetical protein